MIYANRAQDKVEMLTYLLKKGKKRQACAVVGRRSSLSIVLPVFANEIYVKVSTQAELEHEWIDHFFHRQPGR